MTEQISSDEHNALWLTANGDTLNIAAGYNDCGCDVSADLSPDAVRELRDRLNAWLDAR